MPESYPNHTSNFPILNLGTFARSELVFCELFSLQPFATGYTMPPAASTPPAASAAEKCSGTTSQLQSGHDNSTLQRAAAPFTSTLAARVGYSTYPPCSTLKHHPLQQHQQASSTAPSSSTFHPHPLTSMPAPKQGLQHTPL